MANGAPFGGRRAKSAGPMASDSFASLFEAQDSSPKQKRLRVGQPVEGRVLSITKTTVFVEVVEAGAAATAGGKTEAYLEIVEVQGPEGELTVKEGDIVRARVVEIDEASGGVRLGRSFGKGGDAQHLQMAKDSGMPVEGKVTAVNKGGLEVDLGGGARGFCPNSQTGTRAPRGAAAGQQNADLTAMIGQSLQFKVTELKDNGRSIVLSRRALLEEAAVDAKKRVLANLEKGALVKGTVTAVRDFGFFVDIGGLEALVPRSEFSHETRELEGKVQAGDEIEAQVLEIRVDEKGEAKVSLSVKALMPAPERPAALAAGSVAPGALVEGSVVRIETYGIFLQIEGDASRAGRGLVPVSELGVPRGTDLKKAFPEGTKLKAKVLENAEGRLKLSVRGAQDAAERAEYESVKERGRAPRSLGTFADLLKNVKAAR